MLALTFQGIFAFHPTACDHAMARTRGWPVVSRRPPVTSVQAKANPAFNRVNINQDGVMVPDAVRATFDEISEDGLIGRQALGKVLAGYGMDRGTESVLRAYTGDGRAPWESESSRSWFR